MRARSLLAHAPFVRDRLDASDHDGVCRARRAITTEDLSRAYQLVDAAGQSGNGWRRVTPAPETVHRALPETAVFVAECAGKVVGVMALVPDTHDLGLPGDEAFPRELHLLREMGGGAAEITHAALAPHGPALAVLAQLLQAVFAQAAYDKRKEVFVAVSAHYDRLFEEVLQFDRWEMQASDRPATERFYGKRLGLSGLSQRLAEMDRDLGPEAFLHTFFFGSNVYHNYVAPWSVMAAGTFRDTESLRHLFVRESGLIERLTVGEREGLQNRWGALAFEAVRAGSSPELTSV